MATPQPQKTMSSRLMNMKFMQRNGASSSPAQSDSTNQLSAKRMKRSDGSAQTVEDESKQVVRDEMSVEDKRRREILERQAEAAGDTQWALPNVTPISTPLFSVVNAGYGAIDTSRASGGDHFVEGNSGRTSYGKFNKKVERHANGEQSDAGNDDDDDDDDEDSDDGSSDDSDDFGDSDTKSDNRSRSSKNSASKKSRQQHGASNVPSAGDSFRAKQKAQRRGASRAARKMAAKRKRKDINLNKPRNNDDEDERILAKQRSAGGLSGDVRPQQRHGGSGNHRDRRR